MRAPHRVQLRRTKGWKMPPNTVRVCRPTIFGNPFTIEEMGRHDAVEAYRHYVCDGLWEDPNVRQDQLRLLSRIPSLRGKNLACWCRLNQACHADVLLELANAEVAPEARSDTSRSVGEVGITQAAQAAAPATEQPAPTPNGEDGR